MIHEFNCLNLHMVTLRLGPGPLCGAAETNKSEILSFFFLKASNQRRDLAGSKGWPCRLVPALLLCQTRRALAWSCQIRGHHVWVFVVLTASVAHSPVRRQHPAATRRPVHGGGGWPGPWSMDSPKLYLQSTDGKGKVFMPPWEEGREMDWCMEMQ